MNEEEVIQHLLSLPRAVREHLIATYRDAAALYGEAMQLTDPQHLVTAIATQQSIYQRIANRLLDSLIQDDSGSR